MSEHVPVETSFLAKALSVFADVRPNEVFSVLMLTLDGVLLLASYYFLKVIREPLILSAPGGAEIKSYATAALAVLLVFVFYGYREIARRVDRMRLITYTKIFCASCLVVFCVLGHLGVKIGIPFFLWVGCYSLTILAQLWAFANDIYTPEQGKRLFAIIGVGSSIGALIGSLLAGWAVKPLGLYNMMLVPAGVLMACLAIVRAVNAREASDSARKKQAETPPGGKGGLAMIVSQRYLLLVALVILMVNLINTNGEYILDRTLEATKAARHYDQAEAEAWFGKFKADYFFWANAVGVAMQLLLTSRIFKWFDVRGALLIYPILALGSYSAMTALPVLAIVEAGKVTENALDYSIYNSTKQALWLPTNREEKYVAKQAVDTFVVRSGDLLSGLIVFVGAPARLAFGTRHFTGINVGLAVVFFVIALALGKLNQRRMAEKGAERDAKR